MSLKFETKFPQGNARRIAIDSGGDTAKVHFAADPRGCAECRWFYFRLTETAPKEAHPSKLKLTLDYFDNLHGAADPGACRPVYKQQGKDWMPMRPGKLEIGEDGQHTISWLIDYPSAQTEVALCYPYSQADAKSLVTKTKGYWKSTQIGLTEGGRALHRLSNQFGQVGGSLPGIYLIARERAGEVPGCWVLDGLMREFARTRNQRCLVWAVAMADLDGIAMGTQGGAGGTEIDDSWGDVPRRHENHVFQRDLYRWESRCKPALAIDFHATGISDSTGVCAYLPDTERFPEIAKQATAWANTLGNAIPAKYAAKDLLRNDPRPAGNLSSFFCAAFDSPALSIAAPYSLAGDNVLSRKCYREAGKAIAGAIAARLK